MSNVNNTTQIISKGFDKLAKTFSNEPDNAVMTDILLQADPETGTLNIYDDDDNRIFSAVVDEWQENDSNNFYDEVRQTLRNYIEEHLDKLKALSIIKPYSFILIDEDKETVSEIYLVDDNLMVFDSETLMKNLDQDLDNFFDKLMKE